MQTLRSRFFPTSEFEQQVEELGLRPGEYEASPQLQRWCSRNADLHYVPEYLLKLWGITVNERLGSVVEWIVMGIRFTHPAPTA